MNKMTLQFSLCIPTMDRYDNFLSKNLPKYLDNPLISEIIITDENGNDTMKIKSNFNNSKLNVYINDHKLGPLLNKMKALSLASNEWIALIDSDNFAPEEYFQTAAQFIQKKRPSANSIIAPCEALPGLLEEKFYGHDGYNYKSYAGKNINLSYIKTISQHKLQNYCLIPNMLNLGNYIIHKSIINPSLLNENKINIDHSSSFDVFYFNLLLYEQFDINFHVIPQMKYYHSIHEDSIYLKTHKENSVYENEIKQRFYNLCK